MIPGSLVPIEASLRMIKAKAECYNGSALVSTYNYNDAIISIEIERIGEEGKFFGFGVCQKLNLHLRDVNRELNITTDNSFKISFNDYKNNFATFYVTEVHRDENTNELSITAYDAINKASAHTVAELNLPSLRIYDYAVAIANMIDASSGVDYLLEDDNAFLLNVENANFNGTENLREVLNAIAEATQTIYYIDGNENLVFKQLGYENLAITIDKSQYFTLESSDNRRLTNIIHATELGDNLEATLWETNEAGEVVEATKLSGTTQYIRDNPFWELREDITTLLDNALASVYCLTINQFNCEWKGNYLLEIGDKIALITKDNNTVYSYVINDVISYDGGLKERTQWKYQETTEEATGNPTNLGEALKQTFAKVDKVNKQVEIMAANVEANSENISQLLLTTEGINASVTKIEETTTAALDSANEEIATLTSKVNAAITAEDLTVEIKKELATNGAGSVTTATGFTFNEEGLTVSKSGSEMTTTITEDGMTVYRDNTAVLTANNHGVDAVNLRATTYLIIGENSRFEDYDNGSRTGCFWIGG